MQQDTETNLTAPCDDTVNGLSSPLIQAVHMSTADSFLHLFAAEQDNMKNDKKAILTAIEFDAYTGGTQCGVVDCSLVLNNENPKCLLAEQQKEETESLMDYEKEEDEVYDGIESQDTNEESKEKVEEDAKVCDVDVPRGGKVRPGSERRVFVVCGKKYTRSAFIKNAGFEELQKKSHKNLKMELTFCSLFNVHNVMECRYLHLKNRAILVSGCYVRINMLVDNPARVAVLRNPMLAAKSTFCGIIDSSSAHNVAACSALHLLPGIVFVGCPRLKVGYFEAELHDNLALSRLKGDVNSCGRWCTSKRSHVVVTCGFVHYKWTNAYAEVPKKSPRLLSLIPCLRPGPAGGKEGEKRRGRADVSWGLGRGDRMPGKVVKVGDGHGGDFGKGHGKIESETARGYDTIFALQTYAPEKPIVVSSFKDVSTTGGSSLIGVDKHFPRFILNVETDVQLLNIILVLFVIIVAVLLYMLIW